MIYRSRRVGAVVLSIALGAFTTAHTGWASESANQDLSDQQLGEIQQIVDKYHDVYGGLWADPLQHAATLKVVPGADRTRSTDAMRQVGLVGTAADKDAATGPKKWRLTIKAVGPSLATLYGLMAKVRTAEPWAADSRDHFVSAYVNPKLGRLVIGLDALTPNLVEEAREVFGGLVDVVPDQRPVLLSRTSDSQPYYGSDRESAQLASCTAGFEVFHQVSPGVFHYGMMTAGHCWAANTTVYQGYYDSNGTLHQTGTFGNVTVRSYGNNVVDAEFLDGTATGTRVADWIWLGSTSNPYARNVHSSGTSVFGLQICFDGSFTGENCQGDVDATDVCVQIYQGPYTCHQDRAFSLNGSQMATGGDSGGPALTHDSTNGLVVYGTITAGNGTTQLYYSDLGYEFSALNVGLIVN